jgi:hypothetical protein
VQDSSYNEDVCLKDLITPKMGNSAANGDKAATGISYTSKQGLTGYMARWFEL